MATGAFAFGRTYVDPPRVIPSGRGLLYAAEVRDVAAGSPEMRGFTFDSDSSETTVGVVSYTGSINSTSGLTDDPNESILYSSDDPFTIYGSYAGVMPIRNPEEANARAAKRLALGEGIGVERGFWVNTLAKHANGNILRATAVTPKLGLGLLLEWAGLHYAGTPLVHMGVRAANELAGGQLLNFPEEGAPTSKGGAIIVPGSGYTVASTVNTNADGTSGTAVTPTADQAWLFTSGTPLLYRDPVTSLVAPKWSINQVRAFAERQYTAGVDGQVAAVLINLT